MEARHVFLKYRGSVTNDSVCSNGSLAWFVPCEVTISILRVSQDRLRPMLLVLETLTAGADETLTHAVTLDVGGMGTYHVLGV